jgi:hypothetical protein
MKLGIVLGYSGADMSLPFDRVLEKVLRLAAGAEPCANRRPRSSPWENRRIGVLHFEPIGRTAGTDAFYSASHGIKNPSL